MRDILLRTDVEVEETMKYGAPCFCFRGKAFCYLWMDKKTCEPYFLMVEGMDLQQKSGQQVKLGSNISGL
jgi:hypothetical protein